MPSAPDRSAVLAAVTTLFAAALVSLSVAALDHDVLGVSIWPGGADRPRVIEAVVLPLAAERRALVMGAPTIVSRRDARLFSPAPAFEAPRSVRAGRDVAVRAVSAAATGALRTRARDADADGLTDVAEARLGTDPRRADTDGDTLPDGYELRNHLDPVLASDAASDADGDGLTAATEHRVGDDPGRADTDGDGVADGAADPDHDGLPTLVEQRLVSDPMKADSDADGVGDALGDPDGDGVANAAEVAAGTDPLVAPEPAAAPVQPAPAPTEPAPIAEAPAPAPAPAEPVAPTPTAEPAPAEPEVAEETEPDGASPGRDRSRGRALGHLR